MAVNLPEAETSEGPLDAAKAAGGEDAPTFGSHDHHSDTELLDARPTTVPQSDAERMERKNPLGYSITPATEEEIEEGEKK